MCSDNNYIYIYYGSFFVFFSFWLFTLNACVSFLFTVEGIILPMLTFVLLWEIRFGQSLLLTLVLLLGNRVFAESSVNTCFIVGQSGFDRALFYYRAIGFSLSLLLTLVLL